MKFIEPLPGPGSKSARDWSDCMTDRSPSYITPIRHVIPTRSLKQYRDRDDRDRDKHDDHDEHHTRTNRDRDDKGHRKSKHKKHDPTRKM